MTTQDAALIIDGLAEALEERPNQFNLHVSVVGTQVVSTGGTGMRIEVTGGGSGPTYGMVSTVNADVAGQIRESTDEALAATMLQVAANLREAAAEAREAQPDTGKLQRLLDIVKQAAPPVVTAVALAALRHAGLDV